MLIQLAQHVKRGTCAQQTQRPMGTIPSPKDSQEVDKRNQPHGWTQHTEAPGRLCRGVFEEGQRA